MSGAELSISIVLVTSPSPTLPSTELVTTAINSFKHIVGLESCKVIIVMDGIEISDENRTKKGKITKEMLILYEQYHQALKEQFSGLRYEIMRCEEHMGFSHCVKEGLMKCSTTYAIVAQHDRVFSSHFTRLNELINCFTVHPHIRYIGFPSSSNITHDRSINTVYNINILNSPAHKHYLGDNLYLQPLIFWFDSNHLCHVERYLEIYRPISNLSVELKDAIGMKSLKKMILRKGDFIEDKFGQMQRILLSTLTTKNCGKDFNSVNFGTSSSKGQNKSHDLAKSSIEGKQVITTPRTAEDDELTLKLFYWFGSYLCWENAGLNPYEPQFDKDRAGTTIMVRHLNGRQRMDAERKKEVLQRIAHNKETEGLNPQNSMEEYDFYCNDDDEGSDREECSEELL